MLWFFRSMYVLIFYTGIIIYTGLRLFAFCRLFRPSLKKRFFWPFYLFFPYSFIIFALLRLDRIGVIRSAIMYLPIFFLYLFSFIFLFDIISLLQFLWKQKKQQKKEAVNRPVLSIEIGIALILTLLILVYSTFHAQVIKTAHYSLNFTGREFSPDNQGTLKIVLVSDLHIGPTVGKKWVSAIVDRINDAEPDMVCMAGDIFDSGADGMADPEGIAFELRRINAPLGVYACPGNHDANRRTRSLDEIYNFLSKAGIILLADESVITPYSPNKPDIVVTGRRDARPIGMSGDRLAIQTLHTKDADNEIPVNIKPFLILLDHQPIELSKTAEAGFDLVLCGHTHKGQVFPGNIFTNFIYKKAGGTHYGHWQKENTQAIITSGAGVWGPPLRFGTNSEIAVIEVRY